MKIENPLNIIKVTLDIEKIKNLLQEKNFEETIKIVASDVLKEDWVKKFIENYIK